MTYLIIIVVSIWMRSADQNVLFFKTTVALTIECALNNLQRCSQKISLTSLTYSLDKLKLTGPRVFLFTFLVYTNVLFARVTIECQ